MLSDNQQTAERPGRKCSPNHGIVMSRDPMQVNRLYEVSLSQAFNNNNNNNNNNDEHDDGDDHDDERMITMMAIENENNNDNKK